MSIDGKWIIENENKEFQNELEKKITDSEILDKMLEQADEINELIKSIEVLEVPEEEITEDIQKENEPEKVEISEIEALKANLNNIFGAKAEEKQPQIEIQTEQPVQDVVSEGKNDSTWTSLANIKKNTDAYYKAFDEMYEQELQRLVQLYLNDQVSFEIELNAVANNIIKITDRMPNAKSQLLSDIEMVIQQMKKNSEPDKDTIINQIIDCMTKAGEFNFDQDINVKMAAMTNVKNKLQNRSVEELQGVLRTYTEQDMSNTITR